MHRIAFLGRPSRLWRLIIMLLAAIVIALAGIFLSTQRPASAHDHLLPTTRLMKGTKELQTGYKVIDSSWTQPAGNGEFVTQTAVYSWGWPKTDDTSGAPIADRVPAESKLRLRINKSQRPDAFDLMAYPKVIEDQGYWEPSGQGRPLRTSLKPVVEDGRTVAWDVVFYVNRPDKDYYLVSEGHWKDVHVSGAYQWAHWSFYVKTRNVS
jgi:hypothetical protein